MLEAYRKHVDERAAEGLVPKPLDAEQTAGLVELLKSPPKGEEDFLLDLLTERVPPGVDDSAYVKAAFLADVSTGEAKSPIISKVRAVEILGMMLGGYNISPMIKALGDTETADAAVDGLSGTLLMFNAFHDLSLIHI